MIQLFVITVCFECNGSPCCDGNGADEWTRSTGRSDIVRPPRDDCEVATLLVHRTKLFPLHSYVVAAGAD
jgi:hypothetical protein